MVWTRWERAATNKLASIETEWRSASKVGTCLTQIFKSPQQMKSALLLALCTICTSCSTRQQNEVKYASPSTERLAVSQFETDLKNALLGDAESAWRIGRHYSYSRQPDEALKWFRIAAILGKPKSMHDFFVESLDAKNKNEVTKLEAKIWLNLACQKRNKASINTKNAFRKYGKANEVDL